MSAPAFTPQDPGTDPRRWRLDERWTSADDTRAFEDVERLVVLAAHPDDETLGAGGLIATLAERDVEVVLVLATAGEGSHPQSPTHTPADLATRRRAESAAALEALAPGARTVHLDLADGDVADHQDELLDRLVGVLGDGRSTLLLSPWRRDGHTDHDACGRAAAVAARRTGALLLQFPIWFWQWGGADDLPWERLRRRALDPAARTAKQLALAQHVSQVAPLSPAAGDEQMLPEHFLAHFAGEEEVFFAEDAVDHALDELHWERSDPWDTATSPYEARKRALTLAALPRPDYRRALEIGCSVGVLAQELAQRCDRLVAVDASFAAVCAAASRISSAAVDVQRRRLPQEWPEEWAEDPFDLVVVSEVGYFLSPAELDRLIELVDEQLAPDGDLVVCHWLHDIRGWPLDGPDVHARVRAGVDRPVVAEYRDRDVEILVLSRRPLRGAEGAGTRDTARDPGKTDHAQRPGAEDELP